MQSNFITQLLNLKGIKVTKISHGNSFVKIYITTEPRKHTCPACGSKTSRIHDYREQTIKDLPLQFKHTYLVLRKRRYVCSCGKRFYESYNFLPRYQRMTNRLAFFVCQELTKLTSLTSVAKSANVSVSTVIRIFNHINYGIPTLPKVLCIDEFKGNAETGKYQCRELAKWIQNAESSGIPEFEKCADTYRRWHNEIKNAFKYGYTNGPTEGFNNKIKVLKRISFGLKNFYRFRNRILHCTR